MNPNHLFSKENFKMCCRPVIYNKERTNGSGNDNTITQRMRYSHLVKNVTYTKIANSKTSEYLIPIYTNYFSKNV